MKNHKNQLQTGRSMVEMLGVLMIIGILSVGAISGYSKAMDKLALNKQADMLTQIINQSFAYIRQYGNMSEQTKLIPYLTASGYLPPDIRVNTDNQMVVDSFENTWDIYNHATSLDMRFYLPSGSTRHDQILNILTTLKAFHDKLMFISSGNPRVYGDVQCVTGSSPCLADMTIADMANFINQASSNYFQIFLYTK
jgi:type II secretory pathway pseudopilin PulG